MRPNSARTVRMFAFLLIALATIATCSAQATGSFGVLHGLGVVVDASLLTTFDAVAATYIVTSPITVDHAQGPAADITLDFTDNTYHFNFAAPGGFINLLSPVNKLTIKGGTFSNINACVVDGAAVAHVVLDGGAHVTTGAPLCSQPTSFETTTGTILNFPGPEPY